MSEMSVYSALHNVLSFRPERPSRMRNLRAEATELITGMVTNDVLALVPGEGQYAAALTPKGRSSPTSHLRAR